MADHLQLPDPINLDSRRQLSTGGGSEPARNPRRHGDALETSVAAALAVPRRTVIEGVDPRLVFKLSATSRLADDDLRRRGLALLGDTEDWTYIVAPFDLEATKFKEGLDAYRAGDDEDGGAAKYRGFFELVDDLVPYGPDDRSGPNLPDPRPDEPFIVDVVIWPSPDVADAAGRIREVRAVLDAHDGRELSTDLRPQTTLVRAQVTSECLDALLDMLVVEQVRGPAAPFIPPSDWLTVRSDDLEIGSPMSVMVGVLDDGIAANHPFLRDLIVGARAFPDSHAWADPSNHGTMVAGLAAYGDFDQALHDGVPLPSPAHIFSARILEPDPQWPGRTRFPTDQPQHATVEEAVRALHAEGVRIFNLSVTDDNGFAGPHVSLLTETLDRLARELDIVFVVAAGNLQLPATGNIDDDRHVFHDYPGYLLEADARLAEPAVAANALVIGSVARSAGASTAGGASHAADHAIADTGQISPFSRTGPGVLGAVKPDLVDAGGNYVWSSYDRIDPRNLGVGTISLQAPSDGRLFGSGSGTSFAAPRVSNLTARILDRYPDASANLLRCLVGLSADHSPAAHTLFPNDDDRLHAYGYGLPGTVDPLESDDDRVVMFYEGEVTVDTVAIHPLPIPTPFATGRADRAITIALAYDPPVRRQRREYIAASIRLYLYRAIDADAVERVWRHQEREDRAAMIADRRRIDGSKLRPGVDRLLSSTLHVRHWRPTNARSMSPDDGDTYYLVVAHSSAPWAGSLADEYTAQRYAVAVALTDRDRPSVELYNLVQQQVRVPARVRIRGS